MKRALLVGLNDYPSHIGRLRGCVPDAEFMCSLLEKHENDDRNFDCRLLISASEVTRSNLRSDIRNLFSQPADVALFYFSGHGYLDDDLGGVLVTSDASPEEEGVGMTDIIKLANDSSVKEVVIILDCCHSGAMGKSQTASDKVSLAAGRSILTACRENEPSLECDARGIFRGIFTSFICDALSGGAADVLGKVTVASLYAYVDEVFDAWDQRPLLKANISRLQNLRQCRPQVPLDVLRRVKSYFPTANHEFLLDPSFEPDPPSPHEHPRSKENEKIFDELQKCRAARLIEPVGAPHMYYAAMNSKSCRLTKLGQFYWRLKF